MPRSAGLGWPSVPLEDSAMQEDQDHAPFFELCLVRRSNGEVVASDYYEDEDLFIADSEVLEDMVELTSYRVELYAHR